MQRVSGTANEAKRKRFFRLLYMKEIDREQCEVSDMTHVLAVIDENYD